MERPARSMVEVRPLFRLASMPFGKHNSIGKFWARPSLTHLSTIFASSSSISAQAMTLPSAETA